MKPWVSLHLLGPFAQTHCATCRRILFAKKVNGVIYRACRQCDGLTTIPEVT